MWNLVHASEKGTSHTQTGQPCQDYCAAMVTDTPKGPVLVAACADGAGSAEMADVGARLAVETFLELASEAITGGESEHQSGGHENLKSWTESVRRRLLDEAESTGLPVRQFACTLLTAVVYPFSAWFSQIGDGLIVIDDESGYRHIFWPDSGEYANTTRFLTDGDYEKSMRFEVVERAVKDLALITDGLQMLALVRATGKVHSPFFRPMFEVLRAAPSGADLKEPLFRFLNSDRVNARTDDDKTLLLATRTPKTDHVPSNNDKVH